MSSPYYILDNDNNVHPSTFDEWKEFMERTMETGRRVVNQNTIDGKLVSTVFLGLNHVFVELNHKDFLNHSPSIFETMILSIDGREIYCQRYSTWKEAEEGHKKAAEWAKNYAEENSKDIEQK